MNTKEQIEKGIAWLREAEKEGFRYVKWDGSEAAKECPICHNHSKEDGYYGGNCIWLASAYLHHGIGMSDVKCACNGLLGGSSIYTRLLYMPRSTAQSFIDSKLGAGKALLVRNSNRRKLKDADLKRGDIIIYYRFGLFWHVAIHIGDGRIIDCSIASRGVSENSFDADNPCRVALRLSEEHNGLRYECCWHSWVCMLEYLEYYFHRKNRV